MSVAARGPAAGDPDRPLVDPDALERFMDERLPGPGRISVERHRAGHSNETFLVTRGDDAWVLRRPPRGAFLPTAHDVMRGLPGDRLVSYTRTGDEQDQKDRRVTAAHKCSQY